MYDFLYGVYAALSYPTHLITINKHFYFRICVPADLKHFFPTPVIQKSLKTTNLKNAKSLLLATEYCVQKAFTLLRTGLLDDAMVRHVVNEIVPHRANAYVSISAITQQEKQTVVANNKNTLLSVMIKNYIADKQVEWTDKTKMEVAGVFKLLVDMLGDIDICTITKPMVVELRSDLLKLPPNLYKRFPGKTIQQVLAEKHSTMLSIKSVNKHVARLGALLRYCVDECVIASNPASGLKISQKNKESEERSAYSVEDVGRIVKSLPKDPTKPERYWIPLIGLYSGMRLNEICQLYVNDIQQVNDVWCININDAGDKRLKNIASERIIPIHPTLLELGFLDYVKITEAEKHPRLWMNLQWTKIEGYSNSFGKWFQRYNRKYVSGDPLKVFHSMRHLVADTLKQGDVKDSLISEIMGHSHNSITTSRYGKQYRPEVMLEAMKKLDYGTSIPKWKWYK